jgi:hypothetical protein
VGAAQLLDTHLKRVFLYLFIDKQGHLSIGTFQNMAERVLCVGVVLRRHWKPERVSMMYVFTIDRLQTALLS